jgi:hypothetical protein
MIYDAEIFRTERKGTVFKYAKVAITFPVYQDTHKSPSEELEDFRLSPMLLLRRER